MPDSTDLVMSTHIYSYQLPCLSALLSNQLLYYYCYNHGVPVHMRIRAAVRGRKPGIIRGRNIHSEFPVLYHLTFSSNGEALSTVTTLLISYCPLS